jgi:hypothetical protein
MQAVLEQRTVGRKRKPPRASVKLYEEVMRTARIVAAYRGQDIIDMLSGILAPILDRMEREERAKWERQLAAKKGREGQEK